MCREVEERSHQSHSEQSGAFDEERALLEGRVAFLEDNLAASQAFAAAAAEQAPAGGQIQACSLLHHRILDWFACNSPV